jgi:hypothetical protein
MDQPWRREDRETRITGKLAVGRVYEGSAMAKSTNRAPLNGAVREPNCHYPEPVTQAVR